MKWIFLLDNDITSLYKGDVSYIAKEKDVIKIFIHVPLVDRKPLDLMEYISVPVQITEGLLIFRENKNKNLLAVDELGAFGIELHTNDLIHCKTQEASMGTIFLCPNTGLLKSNIKKTCLGSIMFGMHKSAEDGGDPSQNVWWEVAKVSLTYAEEKKLLSGELEQKFKSNFRLGKRIRGETKKLFGTECKPADPDFPPYYSNNGKQCACQHGTPARFESWYNDLTNQSTWMRTSDPPAGETYMCEEVKSMKKDYICMRFRINQPVAEGEIMSRTVKTKNFGTSWPGIAHGENILTINGNASNLSDRKESNFPFIFGDSADSIDQWYEMEVEDSASDSDPEEISINDAAGPRYRKVGLNGVPMPDSKPQVQSENGEDDEENDRRHHHDGDAGEEAGPVAARILHGRDQRIDAERERPVLRAVEEHERELVLVPQADEVEDRDRGDAGAGERQHDVPEHLEIRAAVDDRR